MTSVGVLYTLSFIMDILEKGDLNGGVIHLVEGFFHDKWLEVTPCRGGIHLIVRSGHA